MIRQIRNSVFIKILWGLLGLYLLNISVDVADPNSENIPEDLTINDQESIIEIIVEQILGYEDAFKEYDDADNEGQNRKTNLKIELIAQHIVEPSIEPLIIKTSKKNLTDYIVFLTKGFQKLDIPPPKV